MAILIMVQNNSARHAKKTVKLAKTKINAQPVRAKIREASNANAL